MKAIVFDFDGVLVDNGAELLQASEYVLEKLGVKITQEEKIEHIGMTTKDFFTGVLKKRNIQADIDFLVEEKRRKAKELVKLKPPKGVIEIIPKLKKKYKIAVAGGGTKLFVLKTLQEYGIEKYFDYILGREEINNRKPNPESYINVTNKLKILPNTCIAIEDTPTGIKAAKAAGIKCIAVTVGLPKYYPLKLLKQAGADIIINNFSEITDQTLKKVCA